MSDFLKDLRLMGGQLNGLVRELPQLAGAEVLESIDENFHSESFFGTPWPTRPDTEKDGRAIEDDGRALLVRSGRLRRSFELDVRGLTLIIHTDTPYAQIHNEGGTITGSVNVAAFKRNRSETDEVSAPGARKAKYTKSVIGRHLVKAHTRTVNTTIPQRQFMGEHPDLDKRLGTLIEAELDTIFGK